MKYQDRDLQEKDVYQTGSTTPPKTHNELTTLLLIAVIFLAGIVSILSILNIRLFSALAAKNDSTVPMALHDGEVFKENASPVEVTGSADEALCIGIDGEPVSELCQNYYDLPAGLYITRVSPGSSAEAAGVEVGDILISLNGISITSDDVLHNTLQRYQAGQQVKVVIYREDAAFYIPLAVEEAAE